MKYRVVEDGNGQYQVQSAEYDHRRDGTFTLRWSRVAGPFTQLADAQKWVNATKVVRVIEE